MLQVAGMSRMQTDVQKHRYTWLARAVSVADTGVKPEQKATQSPQKVHCLVKLPQ
jgi:hypothetical protein